MTRAVVTFANAQTPAQRGALSKGKKRVAAGTRARAGAEVALPGEERGRREQVGDAEAARAGAAGPAADPEERARHRDARAAAPRPAAAARVEREQQKSDEVEARAREADLDLALRLAEDDEERRARDEVRQRGAALPPAEGPAQRGVARRRDSVVADGAVAARGPDEGAGAEEPRRADRRVDSPVDGAAAVRAVPAVVVVGDGGVRGREGRRRRGRRRRAASGRAEAAAPGDEPRQRPHPGPAQDAGLQAMLLRERNAAAR